MKVAATPPRQRISCHGDGVSVGCPFLELHGDDDDDGIVIHCVFLLFGETYVSPDFKVKDRHSPPVVRRF
jgi:hypothetical protein